MAHEIHVTGADRKKFELAEAPLGVVAYRITVERIERIIAIKSKEWLRDGGVDTDGKTVIAGYTPEVLETVLVATVVARTMALLWPFNWVAPDRTAASAAFCIWFLSTMTRPASMASALMAMMIVKVTPMITATAPPRSPDSSLNDRLAVFMPRSPPG